MHTRIRGVVSGILLNFVHIYTLLHFCDHWCILLHLSKRNTLVKRFLNFNKKIEELMISG